MESLPAAFLAVVINKLLEVGLAVLANRTFERRFLRLANVSALQAHPFYFVVAFEHRSTLHFVEHRLIPIAVMVLDLADFAEQLRHLRVTFLFGFFGKRVIHRFPFVILAGPGVRQILNRSRNLAVVKRLEPHSRVLVFVGRGFIENIVKNPISVFERLLRGGAAGRGGPGAPPHPRAVLHPGRRRHGAQPARRARGPGARGGRGAGALRRRGVGLRLAPLPGVDARRGCDRGE